MAKKFLIPKYDIYLFSSSLYSVFQIYFTLLCLLLGNNNFQTNLFVQKEVIVEWFAVVISCLGPRGPLLLTIIIFNTFVVETAWLICPGLCCIGVAGLALLASNIQVGSVTCTVSVLWNYLIITGQILHSQTTFWETMV